MDKVIRWLKNKIGYLTLPAIVTMLVIIFGSLVGYCDFVKKIISEEKGYLLVAIIFVAFLWLICLLCKLMTERKSTKKEIEKIKDVQTLLSDMYGFKRNFVINETEIKIDGSAEDKITIEVVATKYELSACYHEEFVTDVENPEKDQLLVEPYPIDLGERTVKFPITEKGLDHVHWLVEFIPPLKPGEKPVRYGYRTHRKNTHLMTLEEARRIPHFPYERLSYQIIYPTDYVKIRVLFPPRYFPKVSFMVYIAYERNKGLFEFEKLKNENCFEQRKEGEQLEVTLYIKSPKLGFIYQIEWDPIPESEYKKIRESS